MFTVVEVSEPRSRDDLVTHVGDPCRVYRVGDRIAIDPGWLVLSETDSVCLVALSAVLPLTSALCRETFNDTPDA